MATGLRFLGMTLATALVLEVSSSTAPGAGAPPCERLAMRPRSGAAVMSGQQIDAGAFALAGSGQRFSELPAFCRVAATLKVGSANVKTEVWLPADWHGDFQPAGGAFWGGSIPYERMRAILRTGSATAGNNLGIEGATGPSFAIDHPEELANLGNRPYHAMIQHAKALIAAYYGRDARVSVMDECGGGGSRDALAEVQRWPGDLDAVAATSFTNYGTHHGLAQMWLFQATHATPDSLIPPSKLAVIHQAALAACDAKDGVLDGVIEDPQRCAFDPGTLLCPGADAPTCLTAPQVTAVRRIYATPVDSRTSQPLYGPMVPGSELSWQPMVGSRPYPYSESFYKFLVFRDPLWDFSAHPANFGSDVDRADDPRNLVINATNPHIDPFVARGGKLLLLGGWNDDLGPGNNVTYYDSVVAALGARVARDSVRLFMIPGMNHCLGVDYPSAYTVNLDVVSLLDNWRRTNHAPDQFVVTTTVRGQAARPRLVCAYPRIAHFKGHGSTDDTGNFECVARS